MRKPWWGLEILGWALSLGRIGFGMTRYWSFSQSCKAPKDPTLRNHYVVCNSAPGLGLLGLGLGVRSLGSWGIEGVTAESRAS